MAPEIRARSRAPRGRWRLRPPAGYRRNQARIFLSNAAITFSTLLLIGRACGYSEGAGLQTARLSASPLDATAGVGFEPTAALASRNGFQDRTIRPLWHPAADRVLGRPSQKAVHRRAASVAANSACRVHARVWPMAHIQIRDVSPDVHRKLKARAAKAGMSLSEYLRAEVTRISAVPTMEEMIERLRKLPPVHFEESTADIIRAEREERDRRWDR